ncbi:hypothetical protein NCCP2222_34760 [Sporosarcina sp. NCCP-2222]|nr:hypothetical protein NCCP2222_34760 [Sporosarcina sp. NCCP-2222]
MKILLHPDWIVSRLAITALIGTFIAILFVNRELNLTFAIWFLSLVSLMVACNVIYVIFKRKKNSAQINTNEKTR